MKKQPRSLGELEYLRERFFDYLVELRNSGETNMWGASPYLARQFGITHKDASNVLCAWIESFDK